MCFLYGAQENKDLNDNIILNSGRHANALIYLNGSIFENKLYNLNPDTIGTIFAEGDSSYVSRTYGNGLDTSLIRQYFGERRNRGVLFVFTKDRVQILSKRKLRQYIKDIKGKVLFKINNAPLTNSSIEFNRLDLKQIVEIQIVKDFKLAKWYTGEEDVFTVFVMKTKTR